tara:strand:- start:3560 stop:4210 length:651 start_codon:yes stop_codon:yes gene_type:complete
MKLFIAAWQQIKKRIAKLFYKPAIYYWVTWSKLYRILWHSKYSNVVVEENQTLTKVQDALDMLEWKPDRWRELFDVCGTPNYVQHIINESRENIYKFGPRIKVKSGQLDLPLDCDEFSVWAANAIDKNYHPRIFLFSWLTGDGKIIGHAMCLCRMSDGRIFHIGNWGTSDPFSDLREMSLDILYRAKAREAIGWAILDKNLKILKTGKEIPSGSVN